jgi:RNA polymerase nonessential primary-like sigma factor
MDLVRLYLKEIGQIPMLTHELEVAYGRQVQQMMCLLEAKQSLALKLCREPTLDEWALHVGQSQTQLARSISAGQRAREKMVSANLRLVAAIAKKYMHRGLEFLDLVQEGAIGLQRGIEKFDPTKGYRLSTYSYWWIKQGMSRAIAQHSKTIRLPIHTIEKLNKIKKSVRILSQKLGRTPNVRELAASAQMTVEQVLHLLEYQQKAAISLDTLVGVEKDTTLGELLEDDNAALAMEEDLLYSMMRKDISRLMSERLKPQEQQVLSLRFGLIGEDGGLSLGKVGEQMNLTRERIRQVEISGLKKLRQHSAALEGY